LALSTRARVLKENIFLLQNIFGVFYELPKIMRDVKSALCPVRSDTMFVENSLDDIDGYAIYIYLHRFWVVIFPKHHKEILI